MSQADYLAKLENLGADLMSVAVFAEVAGDFKLQDKCNDALVQVLKKVAEIKEGQPDG